MDNTKKKWKNTIAGILLVPVLSATCAAAAATVNVQNQTAMPKATYQGSMDDVYIQTTDDEEMIAAYTPLYAKDGAAAFTDFMGYTVLNMTWFTLGEETAATIEQYSNEERYDDIFPLLEDQNSYTDYCTLRLDSVTRRFGEGYGLEGRFTMTRGGTEVFRGAQGWLTNLPADNRKKNGETDLVIQTEDGAIYSTRLRLAESDSAARRAINQASYLMERSLACREVYLGRLLEAKAEGQEIDTSYVNQRLESLPSYSNSTGDVVFNPEMQLAKMSFTLDQEHQIGLWQSVDPSACTEDSVSGLFRIFRGALGNTDMVRGTVTGLSRQAGETVEFRSDDGRYYAKFEIVPKVLPPYEVEGTRDPAEFFTEGEDVYIGTPDEQDEFDRVEHDRFYKRIVVDDNGKVMAVVPVEYQQGENIVVPETARVNYSNTWRGIFQRKALVRLNTDTGEYESIEDDRPEVLIDPVTWWVRAVIPRENLFVQPIGSGN